MSQVQNAFLDGSRLVTSLNTSLFVVLPIITIFWLVVGAGGIIVPCFFWKYKHRLTLQVCIVTTAFCCYIFWLIAFLSQLNPLVGPNMDYAIAAHIRRVWGNMDPQNATACFPVY